MQKAILTGFKLTQDPQEFHGQRTGNPYYRFAVVGMKPGRNGQFLTVECYAYNEFIVSKVQRMKLHKGSCVDITAEMSSYMSQNGIKLGFEITEINFTEIFEYNQQGNNGRQPQNGEQSSEQKQQEQKKAADTKTNQLLDMLSKENFSF